MHYVTQRCHRMQEHKFDVTYPGVLCSNLYRSHPSMKNSASMFHAWMHHNALCDPQIHLDAKMDVWPNVSRRAFY
jgi:hypothetical protein